MLGFLKSLFCHARATARVGTARVLELETLAQSLKLDIAERDKQIQILKKELELVQSKQESTINSVVGSEIESLIAEMAPSIAQIATQHHLLHVESKPLQGKDVLAVAMRLISNLEERGMILDGTIGQNVGFDCNKQELLSLGHSEEEDGQMVIVRMPAVTFQGRVLKKMAVMAAPPSSD